MQNTSKIHRVAAKLADGTSRQYHYCRRGGLLFWTSASEVEVGSNEYLSLLKSAVDAEQEGLRRRAAFISLSESGSLPTEKVAARRIQFLLYRARVRAKGKARSFKITASDIATLLERQGWCCALSGLPFSWTAGNKAGDRNPYAPSIDRIDSLIGYEPQNIRIVLSAVNAGLAEWGDDVYRKICRAVVGVEGFEPPTSCSQSRRATRLRYTPTENDSETAL